MELFEKERRGIYVYFKSFKDLSKLEKYGNFISYSKRGRMRVYMLMKIEWIA